MTNTEKQPLLMVLSTSVGGRCRGEGGGIGITQGGGFGQPPPFLHFEVLECFLLETEVDLSFVALFKAWQHLAMCDDT